MPRLTAQIVKNTVSKHLDKSLYEGEAVDVAEAWIGGDVLPEARRRAPSHTGELAKSLTPYYGVRASGIRSSSRKAPFVHGTFALPAPQRRRTVPHFPPANQSITRWAKAKGVPLFVLRRAIARRGTPIIPFIAEAVEAKYGRLKAHIDAAAKRIERRWES